jgi:hypothetical protein
MRTPGQGTILIPLAGNDDTPAHAMIGPGSTPEEATQSGITKEMALIRIM